MWQIAEVVALTIPPVCREHFRFQSSQPPVGAIYTFSFRWASPFTMRLLYFQMSCWNTHTHTHTHMHASMHACTYTHTHTWNSAMCTWRATKLKRKKKRKKRNHVLCTLCTLRLTRNHSCTSNKPSCNWYIITHHSQPYLFLSCQQNTSYTKEWCVGLDLHFQKICTVQWPN